MNVGFSFDTVDVAVSKLLVMRTCLYDTHSGFKSRSETGYLYSIFCGFPQSLEANSGVVS
jgi:hypothetical protein